MHLYIQWWIKIENKRGGYLKKVIIISTDTVFDLIDTETELLKELLKDFNDNGNKVCFVSNDGTKRNEMKVLFPFSLVFSRRNIRRILNRNTDKQNYFMVLGNRNVDFILATNFKLLYLLPMWTQEKEDKCLKYGIRIDSLKILKQYINAINNQNNWFYKYNLDDKTKVFSLTSGQSKFPHGPSSMPIEQEEKELIDGFRSLLKDGNITYYQVLFAHFMAAISNDSTFREINYWGIFPSSGLQLNEHMFEFKERARYCMGGHQPKAVITGPYKDNLLVRHTAIRKSHYISSSERERQGCKRHFESIHLNPAYKGKLRDKNVCIFDDYLTYGNSFETARNLLRHEDVNEIIFVSLGKFNKPYLYQDYKLDGDVYNQVYLHDLLDKQNITSGEIDDQARKEVINLHEIFNL